MRRRGALLFSVALALDSGLLRTLSKLALACLVLVALVWAFRAGHFSGVEDSRGRPLEVEDEQEMKAFVLETEEE